MKKVLVILTEGFEEIEAIGTIDFLRRVKIAVTVAGLLEMQNVGAHGIKVTADRLLSAVNYMDYDAVVLPGGMPGATNLYANAQVEKILREFHEARKLIAAICAAPICLVKADILRDHGFTMYPSAELYTYLGTARPLDAMAVIDQNVITGKGPGAVFDFASAIASELEKGEEAERELAAMLVELD